MEAVLLIIITILGLVLIGVLVTLMQYKDNLRHSKKQLREEYHYTHSLETKIEKLEQHVDAYKKAYANSERDRLSQLISKDSDIPREKKPTTFGEMLEKASEFANSEPTARVTKKPAPKEPSFKVNDRRRNQSNNNTNINNDISNPLNPMSPLFYTTMNPSCNDDSFSRNTHSHGNDTPSYNTPSYSDNSPSYSSPDSSPSYSDGGGGGGSCD